MKTDRPIIELINEFLENLDVRDTARKRYRENLTVFITWLVKNSADIRNPKRSEVILYKESLINAKKAVTTIDTYLVPVRQFFKWLENEGIYDDIAAGVHSPRRYQGYRKSYLSADQVNGLLRSVNRGTIQGKRDYAIINLMVQTGLRCIEISRMDVADVVSVKAKGWTLMIQGKGHIAKDREVNVPNDLMGPVWEYLKERDITPGENPPMFINHSHNKGGERFTQLSISKIIKRYMRSVNIDSVKLTAHSLRHTAAINAIKAGAKINEVQSMLGHRYSSSTDIYLRALEAETAQEGTAIRLLGNYYKSAQKKSKRKRNGSAQHPGSDL
jgi:integrase/recombinase XerD